MKFDIQSHTYMYSVSSHLLEQETMYYVYKVAHYINFNLMYFTFVSVFNLPPLRDKKSFEYVFNLCLLRPLLIN